MSIKDWFYEDVKEKKKSAKSPKGLGGWLIIFQISLWLGMVFNLSNLANNFIIWIIYSGLFIPAICLFYSRKKSFIKFFIVFIGIINGLNLLFIFLSFSSSYEMGYLSGQISSSLISAVIWVAYLLKSQRVKNTFVK